MDIKSTTRRKTALIFLAFLVLFLATIYYLTMAKQYSWAHYAWDAGDLLIAIKYLGIPHPPGFPLYVLLGKLFSFIPISTLAFRINLMSLLFGVGSAVLVFGIVYNLTQKSFFGAFFAALFYGLTKDVWAQALITEVHTMMTFFALLAVFCWTRIFDSTLSLNSQKRWLFFLSLVGGLSIGVHTINALFIPFNLIFLVIWLKINIRCFFKSTSNVSHHPFLMQLLVTGYHLLIPMLFLFLLGLSVYLYLPIRAKMEALYNWNNPQTLENFIYHVTGTEYFSQIPTNRDWSFGLTKSLIVFRENLSIWMYPFFILGSVWLYLNKRRWFWVFLGTIFSFLIFIGRFSEAAVEGNYHTYILIPLGLFFIVFGSGLSFFFYLIKRLKPKISTISIFLAFTISCILLAYQITNLWPQQDLSDVSEAKQIVAETFAKSEPNAIIITSGDHYSFAFQYLWHEQYQDLYPNLTIIPSGAMGLDWAYNQAKSFYPQLVYPEKPDPNLIIECLGLPAGVTEIRKHKDCFEKLSLLAYENFILANIDQRPIYHALSSRDGYRGADYEDAKFWYTKFYESVYKISVK